MKYFGYLVILLPIVVLGYVGCETGGAALVPPGSLDGDADSDADADADSDSDADPGPTVDPVCHDAAYDISYNPINVMILLDRSGSMCAEEDGFDNRLEAAKAAINDIVSTTDDKIDYALATFPSPAATIEWEEGGFCKQAKKTYGDHCGASLQNPVVDFTTRAANDIATELALIEPAEATPIAQSLEWAKTHIDDVLPEGERAPTFVLLVTDGIPTCPIVTEQVSSWDDYVPLQLSQSTARALEQSGVPVHVVGFGDAASNSDVPLGRIATSGGTEEFYPATNYAALSQTLQEIVDGQLSCSFDVDWANVDPDGTENVAKACNRMKVLSYSDPNAPEDSTELTWSCDCSADSADTPAWHWAGEEAGACLTEDDRPFTDIDQCGTIELCPNACAALENQLFWKVGASFGCQAIVPL